MNEKIIFLIEFDHAQGDTLFYNVLMPADDDADDDVYTVFGPAMLWDCCAFMICVE